MLCRCMWFLEYLFWDEKSGNKWMYGTREEKLTCYSSIHLTSSLHKTRAPSFIPCRIHNNIVSTHFMPWHDLSFVVFGGDGLVSVDTYKFQGILAQVLTMFGWILTVMPSHPSRTQRSSCQRRGITNGMNDSNQRRYLAGLDRIHPN